MMHYNRTWKINELDSKRELAQKLVENVWTPCTAFACGRLLMVNDSTGPDGAQEYAAIDRETFEQVDSITFGWFRHIHDDPVEAAVESVERCMRYLTGEEEPPDLAPASRVDASHFETPEEHGRCELCR